MREIKFRAWNTHTNTMITKFLLGSQTDPEHPEWTCPLIWENDDWICCDAGIEL